MEKILRQSLLLISGLFLLGVASAADVSERIVVTNEQPGVWNETNSTCNCYPYSMVPGAGESEEACTAPGACYEEQVYTMEGVRVFNPVEKLAISGAGTWWAEGFMALHNEDNDTGIRLYDDIDVKHHIYNNNAASDILRIMPQNGIGGITIEQGGNVGVNTNNNAPEATLDINGIMKLKVHSSAPNFPPCGTLLAVDGMIALTSNHTLCVCSQSAGMWVRTTNGSTACTW